MISRRHVFHLAGFDPIDGAAQHRRFRREVQKFDLLWGAKTLVSGATETSTGSAWQTETMGANWSTTAIYELLDWQDLVRNDIAHPAARHIIEGLITFADFLLSGTAVRYFRASWPYGAFFLVPFLNVILFGVVAIGAGALVARLASGSVWIATLDGVAVAGGIFSVLMLWPGQRWRVRQALADWNFARAFMYGRRPAMDERLDQFAARLVAAVRAGGCDELLVLGHSLGATMAVMALTRALDIDPELDKRGPKICLLTNGSTIPKLALHPAAKELRAATARIAAETGIVWTEYQARRDAISFYRFDPVTLRRAVENVEGRSPHIRQIGIKDMMAAESYSKNFFRIMRLHYQFVMGNERRAQYDYFMFVCGPADFTTLSLSHDGPLSLFAADGALLGSAEQQHA